MKIPNGGTQLSTPFRSALLASKEEMPWIVVIISLSIRGLEEKKSEKMISNRTLVWNCN